MPGPKHQVPEDQERSGLSLGSGIVLTEAIAETLGETLGQAKCGNGKERDEEKFEQ